MNFILAFDSLFFFKFCYKKISAKYEGIWAFEFGRNFRIRMTIGLSLRALNSVLLLSELIEILHKDKIFLKVSGSNPA